MRTSLERNETTALPIPVGALGALLNDLASVLLRMDRELYTARPISGLSGSIGGHVRHLLDHVRAFVEAGPHVLTYDQRERGTASELDPDEALSQIFRLQDGLQRMALRRQDEQLRVRTQIAADGRTVTNWSTLGRELAFVMSHTIHHQAIIALLLGPQAEAVLPARFGYAPSTPASS